MANVVLKRIAWLEFEQISELFIQL